jgi:N-acetylmuramoyl-L-alanine amidase
VTTVYNTSTGSGAFHDVAGVRHHAVTPSGAFHIAREIDGVRISYLGRLFRPKYFNAGIALHGAASVPAYPASHGCVRVSDPAINHIWQVGSAPVGASVLVY